MKKLLQKLFDKAISVFHRLKTVFFWFLFSSKKALIQANTKISCKHVYTAKQKYTFKKVSRYFDQIMGVFLYIFKNILYPWRWRVFFIQKQYIN